MFEKFIPHAWGFECWTIPSPQHRQGGSRAVWESGLFFQIQAISADNKSGLIAKEK
jgi:hypothetical protein